MTTSLKHFMQRSAALSLYRAILRAARQTPPTTHASIRIEARRQFDADRLNNPCPTPNHANFLLSNGHHQLSELLKMLNLTRCDN